jgi:YVTN family beta-propeller protein
MDFRILGPLEAWDGSRRIPLGGAKQRAVLAMLLLHVNETVSRDRLIDALWHDRPPATALHTLETYISRLRRMLFPVGEPPRLVTHPPGWELRLDPELVDLYRFERLVRVGRHALAAGRPEEGAERLRTALALFRGAPLDDLAFFSFTRAEIDRIEEARLGALEERVEADLPCGLHADLIPELQALVDKHPYRERFRAQLMLALYRSGRQADALTLYSRTRRQLTEDLGVDPGPELQRLVQAILQQEQWLDLPDDRHDLGWTSSGGASARPSAPPAPDTMVEDRRAVVPARASRISATRRLPGPWRLLTVRTALMVTALGSVLFVLTLGIRWSVPFDMDTVNAINVVSARTGEIKGQVVLGAPPGRLAEAAGSVWVTNVRDRSVSRIDPRTRLVQQSVEVGSGPSDAVAGAGALWVSNMLDGSVSRIDPPTNRVVQTIRVGNGPSGIAFGDGSIWVANASDHSVSVIDARVGAVVRTIGLPSAPTDLAYHEGTLWVSSQTAGAVLRVDARSEGVSQINVGSGPTAIAAGAGGVWVANTLDGTVSRIDPPTGIVRATLMTGAGPTGLAADREATWVADEIDGMLVRVEPATNRVIQRLHLGSRPQSVALVGGEVWVSVQESGGAHRGGTLVFTMEESAFPSIDPAVLYMVFPPQLLGMTNNGLVTLKHTGGSDGAQLVPDLAISLPVPTDEGRTYHFQLRRGIVYSDGRPVQPADFRRAIERTLRLGSPGAGFFTRIVGADRCLAVQTTCDLSKGISTNDAASTVTFHLSAPDPEFLYKLALTFAFAVPEGTPNHDVGTQPVPATGPYMIASYSRGKELRLIRNPHFRMWSQAARPDGFADQIVWRLGVDAETAVTEIERGRADSSLNFFTPPIGHLERLRSRYPAQIHVNPLPETEYVAVNAERPPFDDVRVRRALNYAIDRRRIAALRGSPDLARPTCQVLPPGVPGYRPYCPYTIDPNTDGTWTAPDLVLAKRLVAASGTRGMGITFVVDPIFKEGDYIASVLRGLGYRVDLRRVSTQKLMQIPTGSVNVRPGGWAADYPAASNFIQVKLCCRSFGPGTANTNESHFCNPRIDAMVEHALKVQTIDPPTANRLWTRIDRALVDQAAWVPEVNLDQVDFVSRRVGNYQFHPQWGVLLDQLWVVP